MYPKLNIIDNIIPFKEKMKLIKSLKIKLLSMNKEIILKIIKNIPIEDLKTLNEYSVIIFSFQ